MAKFNCPHCGNECTINQRLWKQKPEGTIWHWDCADSAELIPKPPTVDEPQQPEVSPLGLGDVIEIAAKPIARALRLKCLDDKGNLKPDSGCAKRKAKANRVRIFKGKG